MSKRVLKAAVVEWVDAASTAEWMSGAQAAKEKVCSVTSLGFLLSGGKKNQDVKLAGHVGDDEVMGVLTIPAQWVVKITYLDVTATLKEPDDD